MNSTNATSVRNISDWNTPYCPPIVVDTQAVKNIKIAAFSLVMVLALLLNSLVIAVFAKTPALQRTVNYFMVNMAASDLLIPIAAIPREILTIVTGSETMLVDGDFGSALCKLQAFLVDISAVVSILTMVCITVDRFCAVMMPLRLTLIPTKARGIIIGLIWLLAVVNYAHYFYTLKLFKTTNGDVLCIMDWSPLDHLKSSTIVATLYFVLYGVLPWILVAVLYTAIVIGLKRAHRSVHVEAANAQNSRRTRNTMSVTRQVFTIVFVFSVCYFPLSTLFMVVVYVYHFTCSPLLYWSKLFFAAQFMVFANSALNPGICLFLNENYRNGLWRLLRLNNDRVHPEIGLARGRSLREEPLTRST